jgi:hypothetical protein
LSLARARAYIRTILVGALFVVLHRGDGGEVIIAPAHITSLRVPGGGGTVLGGSLAKLAPFSNCHVYLDDGKFLGVLETCAEVRRQLEAR